MAPLKIMDLFSGTGGFSKGFEDTGAFEVVYGIDVLPEAIETFRLNHPRAVTFIDDIRQVRLGVVAERTGLARGEVDVIVGGPPCQGFSSIRPFRSMTEDDPRNSLFEEFAAYVNYFRPAVFVMENVVGLATYKNGTTIEQIEKCFSDLGYDVDWRVLNAAHFGVPQKRERLILIGAQEGVTLKFPQPTHAGIFRTIGLRERHRILAPAENGGIVSLFEDHIADLPRAVTVMEAIGDLPRLSAGEQVDTYSCQPLTMYQEQRRLRSTQLEWHVATAHSSRMLEIIKHSGSNISSVPEYLITSGFSSCYSRLEPHEPAVTITVNFVHPASNKCIHPYQDRALTIREGARLQSFDDDFKFAGNRTKIAKQIGNAVPPLLGRAIAESVQQMFGVDAGYAAGREDAA
ncbi:DNA cytosine methyltransferase [Candidatus Poriferisodalis sp.]|uniref:DNA cytosine methyltransferase n=1 Tax=Candidatus Poriferisodalis sp. TaxID=3101277 RepID=UPI003B022278